MSNCVVVKCMVCKKLYEPSDAVQHITSMGHNLWELKKVKKRGWSTEKVIMQS